MSEQRDKPCKKCHYLLHKDFDGIPYWRCGLPKEKASLSRGDTVKEWLREYLKDGPKPIGIKGLRSPPRGTVLGEGMANGFSYTTIRRASVALGIRKRKDNATGKWMWTLPQSDS